MYIFFLDGRVFQRVSLSLTLDLSFFAIQTFCHFRCVSVLFLFHRGSLLLPTITVGVKTQEKRIIPINLRACNFKEHKLISTRCVLPILFFCLFLTIGSCIYHLSVAKYFVVRCYCFWHSTKKRNRIK